MNLQILSLSKLGRWLGPLAALALLLFADLEPGKPLVTRAAAVGVWMALWWLTEAVPLWATALLPSVLFPVLGVASGASVASHYFSWIIFLFLGGFLMAIAMERWNLHKRIALNTLQLFGTRPHRLMAGFMCATFVLSMWISNTSATMMMVPIAMAVLARLEQIEGKKHLGKYPVALLLGVAYSATLGGIVTLVGTPPNLTLVRTYTTHFPQGTPLGFVRWMLFAGPLALALLLGLWLYLKLLYCPAAFSKKVGPDLLVRERRELGTISFEEKSVFFLFCGLVLAWLTRANLNLGFIQFPGWSEFLPWPQYINDGTVAITVALLLFILPAKHAPGEPGQIAQAGTRLLDSSAVEKLPWGIVLLFGGGLALANGLEGAGVADWIGRQGAVLGDLPLFWFLLLLCLLVTSLGELSSNTAMAEVLLPIAGAIAVKTGMAPLQLMAPVALACSLGFMLPVATPPNAIVFATGRISIVQMAVAGFWLNLVGALAVTAVTLLYGGWALGY